MGGRGAESVSDDEGRSSFSSSDEEDVENGDMAGQMHSTILEEEHDDEQPEVQRRGSGVVDKDIPASVVPAVDAQDVDTQRAGFLCRECRKKTERDDQQNSGSAVGASIPRTPGFDPRNRRSTIILHERPSIDQLNLELQRTASRRPSNPSHQLLLAKTSSKESRRNSYFGTYAAAAGSRLDGVPAGAAPVEDEVTDEKSDKVLVATSSAATSGDSDDEKKAAQLLVEPENPDEVSIDMGSITHPSLTESTALVIPCHNADVEVLKAVLFAALVHFEPWQIFVVEHTS